jgi:TrkA domain protein
MVLIEEMDIAGIGRKFTVGTHSGDRLVIIVHDAGMIEVYHSPAGQPDNVMPVATLDDEQARQVAAIIGRTIYRPEAIERLSRYGVSIAWHTLASQAYAIDKSLADLGISHQANVSIITVIEKDSTKISNPGHDYILREGIQIALAGTPKAIQACKALLDKGSL